MDFNVKF